MNKKLIINHLSNIKQLYFLHPHVYFALYLLLLYHIYYYCIISLNKKREKSTKEIMIAV